MNLYQLAKQVKPDQLKDHESKVIWKGKTGEFAYIIRDNDYISLRLSGSQFQLGLWEWHASWVCIASQVDYEGMVKLWQDERLDRI